MPRLMLRDTLTLVVGAGTDENGDPVAGQSLVTRGEVIPISGEEQALRGRLITSVEYRIIVTDPKIELATKAIWRGVTYAFQGKPMAYRLAGRTHHYEVVMRVGTG